VRKIIAGLFISLDGVYEAPDQWHFPYFNDEMGREVDAQVQETGTILFGRQTYQEFESYWPQQGSEVELADYFNQTPKLVVSNSLTTVSWQNTTLVRGDVMQELNRIKREPGKNISIVGSGTLVRSLLAAGLLDELRLLVHPIAVNSGKRLFPGTADGQGVRETGRVPLTLLASKTLSTGVLSLTYGLAPPGA
jgi:dihydrofolate reductase